MSEINFVGHTTVCALGLIVFEMLIPNCKCNEDALKCGTPATY